MNFDEAFIRQAFKLAQKGRGWTNPNPMVGAVVVKDKTVIGTGYHKKFGSPHAEVEALRNCRENPKGATLYVNLEPCNDFGKTPPCTEAIISAGVKKVVCSISDPNPKTHGQGLKRLKQAGISVVTNVLARQARVLNEAFFTFYERKRPFVAIKFAAGLDGKIATKSGDSKWITNEKARNYARKLRVQYQAVLVGINTVFRDDPHLGVRTKGKKDPIRIILDSKLQIPLDAKVLRDPNVIIAATKRANRAKLTKLENRGFEVMIFDGDILIPKLLEGLSQREIISVLVEGGGQVLGSFIDAKVVDKVYAFHAPILIGGEKAVSAIGGKGANKISDALKLTNISFKSFDDDWLTTGYPNFSNFTQ